MEFKNAGIEIGQLPKAEELQLQSIDPRYLKVLWRQWLARWLIIFIIAALVIFFSPSLQEGAWIALILGGVLLIAIANWIIIAHSFRYKAFGIREHDIIYRTGWLVQSTRACPFNRIQHCSVEADMFERQFGLASLSVYTAGGNEADMKIPGLSASAAADLREMIVQKTGTDASRI